MRLERINMSLEINKSKNIDDRKNLDDMYDLARATIETDSDMIAMMANISAVIMSTIKDLNWAGFYIARGDELVLGPFQGLPACTRLKDSGVCWAAFSDKSVKRVDDVHDFDGHVACDSASNSELVIPIIIDGEVIAVLDIDSPLFSRFSEDDEEVFSKVINYMVEELSKSKDYKRYL